jgi:hypothetical protein
MRLMTKDIFVAKAIARHGDTYVYDQVVYVNNRTYVVIICPIHGPFSQQPDSHLMGRGCKECGIIKNRKKLETFIEQAQSLHGDKYDYSEVSYVSNLHKVTISCPIHGQFQQLPMNHLVGNGCPQCGGKHGRPSVVLSTDEFIEKATAIHSNLYDYSAVVYKNTQTSVDIHCRKHGIFRQRPHCHLRGQGCPSCRHYVSKPEAQWLDSLNVPLRQHKIKLPERKHAIKVDGFDPATNTVYQFHGNYYHGNPTIYRPDTYNTRTKCSMGDLYRRTIEIEEAIRNGGYNLIVMWQSEWDSLRKTNKIGR